MCGRIGVQRIYTDDLVVRAGSQVFVVRGEAHRVDRARVMADGSELLWLGVFGVVRVQNGLGRPDAHIAVCLLLSVVWPAGRIVDARCAHGVTDLRRRLRGAFHQARRGSCTLHGLSDRLEYAQAVSELLQCAFGAQGSCRLRSNTHQSGSTTAA